MSARAAPRLESAGRTALTQHECVQPILGAGAVQRSVAGSMGVPPTTGHFDRRRLYLARRQVREPRAATPDRPLRFSPPTGVQYSREFAVLQ